MAITVPSTQFLPDLGIHLEPAGTEEEMTKAEKRYNDYREVDISSTEKLEKAVKTFFENTPNGETKAMQYLSDSQIEDTYAVYIKTKDPQLTTKMGENIWTLFNNIPKEHRITIIGKGEADLYNAGRSSSYVETETNFRKGGLLPRLLNKEEVRFCKRIERKNIFDLIGQRMPFWYE